MGDEPDGQSTTCRDRVGEGDRAEVAEWHKPAQHATAVTILRPSGLEPGLLSGFGEAKKRREATSQGGR